MPALTKACIGVLYDKANSSVLLACRPPGKLYAGYWEFPGGKHELNEDAFKALSRELAEELGVRAEIKNMTYLKQLEQQYPHGLVQLDVILVTAWLGVPQACEKQRLVWQPLNSLALPQPLLPTTAAVFQLLTSYTDKQ